MGGSIYTSFSRPHSIFTFSHFDYEPDASPTIRISRQVAEERVFLVLSTFIPPFPRAETPVLGVP